MVGASPSEQVIQTIAKQSNIDALDLPPLFDTLDPDSLDKLIRGMTDGKVSFEYAGYYITINSRGAIEIDEQSQSGSTVTEAAAGDD